MLSLFSVLSISMCSYVGTYQDSIFKDNLPEYFRSDIMLNVYNLDLVRTSNQNEVKVIVDYSFNASNFFFNPEEYKLLPDLEKQDYNGFINELSKDGYNNSTIINVNNDLISKCGADFLNNLYYVDFMFSNPLIDFLIDEESYHVSFYYDLSLNLQFLYRSNNNYYTENIGKTIKKFISVDYTYNVSGGSNILLNNALGTYFTNEETMDSVIAVNINSNFLSYRLDNTRQVSSHLDSIFNSQKVGFDNGYKSGYSDGVKKNLDTVNPITLAFNGIANVLNIEIFPGFKLAYGVMFALMVMLVRFALSFFH